MRIRGQRGLRAASYSRLGLLVGHRGVIGQGEPALEIARRPLARTRALLEPAVHRRVVDGVLAAGGLPATARSQASVASCGKYVAPNSNDPIAQSVCKAHLA